MEHNVSYSQRLWRRLRLRLLQRNRAGSHMSAQRVCVIIQDFPTSGGVGTVLKGLEEVTKDIWRVEYLTQYLGSDAGDYIIHTFGTRRMTPWYFPFVWLYVVAGLCKCISLLRREAAFRLLLPQDAVFSGALAGIAGKLCGVRVVCIDHGDLSLFTPRNQRLLQAERAAAIAGKDWPWIVRLLARKLLVFYWPSRYLLARIAAHLIDQYLIPGVAGDSVEEGCKLLGIHPSRIVRYGSMIDMRHHALPDQASRAAVREQRGWPTDALIVAIACRLAPEKGLDIALESISQALSALPERTRERVRIIIAGEGPLRSRVEDLIIRYGLSECCSLLGALSSEAVVELLSISDIFLYTSSRGACYAMAVLEAMASACAVIASTEPLSNALLLAEGRGCAVAAGDVVQTSQALIRLLSDEQLRRRMGMLARAYIEAYHSPATFRSVLLSAAGGAQLHTTPQHAESIGNICE